MSCEFGTHLGGKLVSSVSFPPRVPSNLKAAQLSLCPLLLPHVSSILPSLLLPMDTELIMAGVAAREGENSCPEKESASFSLFLSFFCLDTEHLHTQSRKTRTRCGILSSFLFLIVAFPSLPTPPPTATVPSWHIILLFLSHTFIVAQFIHAFIWSQALFQPFNLCFAEWNLFIILF